MNNITRREIIEKSCNAFVFDEKRTAENLAQLEGEAESPLAGSIYVSSAEPKWKCSVGKNAAPAPSSWHWFGRRLLRRYFLSPFGIPKEHFGLFLKNYEWRFNNSDPSAQLRK